VTVPPHVIAASLAALGLHDPAVPVAHLVQDSLVDDVAPFEGTDRLLVFATSELSLDLSVTYVGDRRRLRVAIDPGDIDSLVLVQPGNDVRRPVKDLGADVADVLPGLTSIAVLRGADPCRTAWVVI